jgi:gas vesicle protein
MAKTGKTIATLLIGAAAGAVVGYLLATDKDKRKEDMEKLKVRLNDLKDDLKAKLDKNGDYHDKHGEDIEHQIYKS